MHWIFPTPPDGELKDRGYRRDGIFADGDAVCGITSMYDAEKGIILTAGGAPNYHYWFRGDRTGASNPHREEPTNNAFEITLGNPGTVLQPKRVDSMKYPRIFANAVIVPTGETLVVGGQRQGEPFRDDTWQPVPEIYSPNKTPKWREVADHSTPRAYHSWALLLPDATVVVGGGGLSGNQNTNHYDAQTYRPGYLFTGAAQPKIKTVDKKLYKVSKTIHITTDVEVDGASLIRYSAPTHTLNNDLRRIKLTPTPEGAAADKKYSMQIPNNAGIALPGYWMLFVLRNGVPSHAARVQILKS
jgi:galactose oxidase